MKIIQAVVLLILLSGMKVTAQFSLDSFLNEPINYTPASIKEKLNGKKWEEKDVKNFKAILFYDWIAPVSVKVGYLFSPDGTQKGKYLRNAKENGNDASLLLDTLKSATIRKYGAGYTENSMMGITVFTWNMLDDIMIMLAKNDAATTMMLIRK